jgi:hypothetical protein
MIFKRAGAAAKRSTDKRSNQDKRFSGPLVRPGRCPLYVRAQLETAGLTWTQRDFTPPKRTAREAANSQLTGYFRR